MQLSGQMIPHEAHPVQASGCAIMHMRYPFPLTSTERAKTLQGQASTQTPQPLQCSLSTTIVPLIFAILPSILSSTYKDTKKQPDFPDSTWKYFNNWPLSAQAGRLRPWGSNNMYIYVCPFIFLWKNKLPKYPHPCRPFYFAYRKYICFQYGLKIVNYCLYLLLCPLRAVAWSEFQAGRERYCRFIFINLKCSIPIRCWRKRSIKYFEMSK